MVNERRISHRLYFFLWRHAHLENHDSFRLPISTSRCKICHVNSGHHESPSIANIHFGDCRTTAFWICQIRNTCNLVHVTIMPRYRSQLGSSQNRRVVNLRYAINFIENVSERDETLWSRGVLNGSCSGCQNRSGWQW